jgi:hypothetical protein
MLFDLGTLALVYAPIALEKSHLPLSSEGGLFSSSLARIVASSMENPAPADVSTTLPESASPLHEYRLKISVNIP